MVDAEVLLSAEFLVNFDLLLKAELLVHDEHSFFDRYQWPDHSEDATIILWANQTYTASNNPSLRTVLARNSDATRIDRKLRYIR